MDPLSQNYMEQSLDLFERLVQYAESANQKLDMIGEFTLETGATLELLSKTLTAKDASGKPEVNTAAGSAANIDKLISKVDVLVDTMSKSHNTGGITIESKSIGDLGTNILTFAKGISESVPHLEKSKSHIPFITESIRDFLVGLVKGVRTDTLERALSATKVLTPLVGNIAKFGRDLKDSVIPFTVAKPFIPFIAHTIQKLVTTLVKGVGEKVPLEKAEMIGKTVAVLAGSITKLAKDLLIATPLLILATPGILLLRLTAGMIGKIASIFAEKEKEMNTASGLITKMGVSMIAFAGGLALSMLIMTGIGLTDIGKLLVLFGGMAIAAFTFSQLGKNDKELGKGALGMLAMSASMVLFAGALKITIQLMPDAVSTAGTLLAIAGFALVFGIAGKFAKEIAYGALAIAGVGLSLLVFSIPLTIAVAAVKAAGFEGIGATMLALASFGALYYFAGKFFVDILMGALAFAGIGLSLRLLAGPITEISNAMKQNQAFLWQLPVLLTGLGVVFGLAGAASAFIIPGAIAMAAIGGGLWAVSKGIGEFAKMPTITKEKAEGFEHGIRGIVNGFGKAFSDLGILEIATLPLKIPIILAMGAALIPLGMGLRAYKAVSGEWKAEDGEILAATIQSLSSAFSIAGSTDGMTKLLGFNVGRNDVERGIDSTMKIGKNLNDLASGIKSWLTLKLTPKDVQTISDNVNIVLSTIPAVFASVGMRARKSKNQFELFGAKFGVPFSDDDVELGIESTMKMGKNLKELAEGVRAWKTGGKSAFSIEDLMGKDKTGKTGGIIYNISQVLGAIPSAFAEIGRQDKATEGIWWWSKGDVTKGADIATKFVPALKQVGDVLNTFKNITNPAMVGSQVGIAVRQMIFGVNQGLMLINDSALGRLDRLIKSMKAIPEVFKAVNSGLKDHIAYIGKLSPDYISNFSKWAEALDKFASADVAGIERNNGASDKIVDYFNNPATLAPAQTYTPANTPQYVPQTVAPVPTIPSQQRAQQEAHAQGMDEMKQLMSQLVEILGGFTKGQGEQTLALNSIKNILNKGIKVTESSM